MQLCAPITGPRGNRSCALLTSDGKPVTCKLPPTTTPFNAGVYGDAPSTRLNLDLVCDDPAYQKFLNAVDEFVLQTICKNSSDYFKSKKTPEEVRAAFKRSIKTIEREGGPTYAPLVRTKINVAGQGCVTVWDENKQSRALPEDWRKCSIQPILIAKSVYFLQGILGVTYQIDDCIVHEKSDECPF